MPKRAVITRRIYHANKAEDCLRKLDGRSQVEKTMLAAQAAAHASLAVFYQAEIRYWTSLYPPSVQE